MKRLGIVLITIAMLLSLVITNLFAVSASAVELPDGNGEKVVYIPLDDRPVNKDRVIYLAEAAGLELLIPETELYATVLDPNYKNMSDQGNPKDLFEWLKSVAEEADYFVISLDQLFSGGLVGSRAPFGDTDDTIANGIGADGRYTLSQKEQEIVDYLIQLSNRANTHVVYFDTVMRLASTGNYFDYRGDDYSNFRSFGLIERQQFTGDALNIDNIVSHYNYDKNNSVIAVELTDANKSNYSISYGETAVGSMVFNDINNVTRGLNADEYKEYFAARERKLRIAEALYPNVAETVDRLYIGVDDSNPKVTIQTNECNYITEKLIKGYDQCALFAGADELGLMGIADIATCIYGNFGVNLQYFGNGKDGPADEFDKGTLDETVKTHITAVGADYNSASPEMDILVLTRTDNGDGYNSTELTELNNQVSALVAKAVQNQQNGTPTCIIDTSCRKGLLSQALLDSTLDISKLMGYSEWNTVSNALGIGISNAVARYAYLAGVAVTDAESQSYYNYSHVGFLKATVFSWVKDYAYQQKTLKPYPSESDFDAKFNEYCNYAKIIADKVNQGSLYVGRAKNGTLISQNLYDVSVFNLNWPWDRDFECSFDIGVYENGFAPATGKTVSNLALNKPYTTSLLYQQGGADVQWGWSDTAPITYPDEGGITLTDGIIASATGTYNDVEWAGFHPKSPDFVQNKYSSVTIDLGETKDIYRASLCVGTTYLKAGIATPYLLELYVSDDNINFTKVGETYPTDNGTQAYSHINIFSKYGPATARYVQIRINSGNYMFVCEAEVYGCDTTPDSAITTPNKPDPDADYTYTESIVIDGYYNDTGWANGKWTEVSPENGYWQTLPTTENTISYRYQMRTDGTKLYVAVQADCALVVGSNGVGTNLRFWINTNESATCYTHFYDVNGVGTGAKYNTSTTVNSGANIENSSINGTVISDNGKSNFEFSVDLSEFNGEDGFNYFIAVSNYKDNENLSLYYPPVTENASRATNLPYNNWDYENQGVCDTASTQLGEATTAVSPRLEFESYVADTSLCYTYWDTNDPDRFKDDASRLINGIKGTIDGWSAEYSAWKMNKGDILDVDLKLASTSKVDKVVAYFAGDCAGVSAPKAISVAYSSNGSTYTAIEAECKIEKVYTAPSTDYFSLYEYTIELPAPVLATHIKASIHIQPWGTGMMWVDEIEAYGEIVINEEPHTHTDANGEWETDGTNHFHTCACGEVFDKMVHTGGEATCKDKATCSVCGASYGELNANNHKGETYKVDEATETCGDDGYTGDTYCEDCDVLLEKGETIPATGNHTGGEATCKDKATCSVCGDAYGELNANNHKGETYKVGELGETCGDDGYTGDIYCEDCDALLEKGETIPATGNHTGGEATCKNQAICSVCGDAYGELNANNHKGETYKVGELGETCGDDGYTGDIYCSDCDQLLEKGETIPATGEHTGGEATCKDKATCSVCGDFYGELNANNHKGETYKVGELGETCGDDGYTGDVYCSDCKQLITKGEAIPATGNHTGGEATCKNRAICSVCGDAYGELNANNHKGETYKENELGETCGDDGYTGDIYCSDCKQLITKGEAIPATGNHTGGEATCKDKATCSVCGDSYGELNANNHKGETYKENELGETCGDDGYTGDTYCEDCDALLEKGETIPATGNHTGGEATCKNQAICSVCGDSYGELNANNHKGETYKVGELGETCGDDGYTGDIYCSDCDQLLEKGEVIPATGNHTGGEATCKDKATCSVCGDSYGELNANNHKGETYKENELGETCGDDGYTGDIYCSDCDQLLEKGEVIIATGDHVDANGEWETDGTYHFHTCACGTVFEKDIHTGGEATCKNRAICSVCGASYGELNANNHKGETYKVDEAAASCKDDGYTGDIYCSDCDQLLEKGEVIIATGDHVDANGEWETDGTYHFHTCACGTVFDKMVHTGGEATCKDKAICSVCGDAYGELNANNHKGETYKVDEATETCGDDGYTGDIYCSDCKQLITKGETIPATGNHTGGEATCKNQAICSVCGDSYGELNANNHKGETYKENELGETCGDDGYTGDTYCSDCKQLITKGESIPATGNHTGGEATCKDKAICSVCGDAYGELNANNHKGETYKVGELGETCGDDGYTGDIYCEDCDALLEKGETIPATGNHTGGEWEIVTKPTTETEGLEQQKCTVCGQVIDTREIPVVENNDVVYEYDDEIKDDVTVDAENAFLNGATVIVEFVKDIAQDILDVYEKAFGVCINAIKNNLAVKPAETITMVIDIPDDFSTDVSVYYKDENGEMQKADIQVDDAKRQVSVSFNKLTEYYLVDNNSKIKIGDVNMNGKIDARDYLLLKRAFFKTYELKCDQKIADVNGNGKLDARDYLLLKRAFFGTYTIQ